VGVSFTVVFTVATPKSIPTDFTALLTACLNCCCTALPAGVGVITFLFVVGFTTAFGAAFTVGVFTVVIIFGFLGLGFFGVGVGVFFGGGFRIIAYYFPTNYSKGAGNEDCE